MWMKRLRSFSFVALLALAAVAVIGCGGGAGGGVGDVNDPATTGDDDEQMQDETGEFPQESEE